MGTEFQEVLCDEHAIGGDGEYCGDNDAQFGRINVLYFEASGGKHIPRAVFFDLERRGSNQENPGFCGFSPTPAAGPAFPCALPMPLVLRSSVVGDIAPL
jgi:hypothetical protein